jgi:hypothetical protein
MIEKAELYLHVVLLALALATIVAITVFGVHWPW